MRGNFIDFMGGTWNEEKHKKEGGSEGFSTWWRTVVNLRELACRPVWRCAFSHHQYVYFYSLARARLIKSVREFEARLSRLHVNSRAAWIRCSECQLVEAASKPIHLVIFLLKECYKDVYYMNWWIIDCMHANALLLWFHNFLNEP